MKTLWLYLKYFFVVALLAVVIGFIVLVANRGSISLGTDESAFKMDGEGPHLFYQGDVVHSHTIRGSRDQGFWVEKTQLNADEVIDTEIYFAKEDLTLPITVSTSHQTPASTYNDGQPILALSDIEGNFAALRDFLIVHNVIDEQLNWQFAKGHLVLVGDMVDRGNSTIQLLWLINHLEHQADAVGGKVHFIIGNHEIKNMYGDFKAATDRYFPVAAILDVQQGDLFGEQAVLGRWLSSKNVVEKINGFLFTHGGLHPDVANLDMDLDSINQTVREHYRHFYYPRNDFSDAQTLLISNKTGPAWFRGYFKDQVSDSQLTLVLNRFDAKAIVVGHTVQFSVNRQMDGKLFAIDVKHPGDYSTNIPAKL